jgi:hypothetical protein
MDWDRPEPLATLTASEASLAAPRKPPWASPTPRVRINFRIPQDDLERLKKLAFIDDIHYQTLIVSILHRYVTGELVDRQTAVNLLRGLRGE